MTDKKKERERGKASRRGRGSVVLSGLIGTRSVLSARCQSIIENARRLDERRRDRHRYIYIHLYIRPTRQNSQLQESVRISTWRAFFGVEVAHSAREEAGKGWIDACTALRRPAATVSSSREPASNPFIRSARRAWRMGGKSSVGNRVTGCKVMDTTTTTATEFHYRARAHTRKNPVFSSLPHSSSPFSLPRRLSSLVHRLPPPQPSLPRPTCPYSSPGNSTCNQARKLATLKPSHLPKPTPSSFFHGFVICPIPASPLSGFLLQL